MIVLIAATANAIEYTLRASLSITIVAMVGKNIGNFSDNGSDGSTIANGSSRADYSTLTNEGSEPVSNWST